MSTAFQLAKKFGMGEVIVAAHYAMTVSVDKNLDQHVPQAVFESAYRFVEAVTRRAVHWGVNGATHKAIDRALSSESLSPQAHPELNLYLEKCAKDRVVAVQG
jgi:hypothetical protein